LSNLTLKSETTGGRGYLVFEDPDSTTRIWPTEWQAHSGQEVRAHLTLNAMGPRPGPPAAILAKTFRLTPSEAKLACIIARGAPPYIAARELKISRETARNQLKSVFAKTDTHRQSELVALLLQVE
jgi:DNA-binding CsgD family transcriptional regulator